MEKHTHYHGLGWGTLVAAAFSWFKWQSLGWAAIHGIFGWFYVIYFWVRYGWPF